MVPIELENSSCEILVAFILMFSRISVYKDRANAMHVDLERFSFSTKMIV
eukprot:CAMPEP_0119562236 /NCGR_PEP_ID=MMETSP1352-20130426/19844_1 /TAXON_ID=265584 /ORGANISM="Stauroneis constricta, Strain CCMP1120" /LENGTH=49 /DNA_ID=CAMNT_0007610595 /DNA_START=17 /DNA_END=166 /DNA_ORIENTATION=-